MIKACKAFLSDTRLFSQESRGVTKEDGPSSVGQHLSREVLIQDQGLYRNYQLPLSQT
jgi:hypothetical protein